MRSRLQLLVILGALSAFGPLSIDFYLPGLPKLTRDFEASASAGQLTLTACLLGLALGQLVAGPLSDRFGRRPPLLIGLAAYCAASIACALAPTIWMLIGLRLVQGLGGAAGLVVARSIVRDLRSGAEAARLYSILMLVAGVVPVLAPVLGGQLLDVVSWRWLFVMLGVFDALLLAASAFGLRETLPPERRHAGGWHETRATFVQLASDRVFLAYAFVLGLGFGTMFAYIAGSSFVLENRYGLSPRLYGAVFGLNAVGIVACSQLNGLLVRRVSLERLIACGLLAAGAGAGMLAAIVLRGGIGLAGILPCLFVIVATVGMVLPNATALALHDYPHAAGSASAVLGVFQFGVGATTAPLVGIAGRSSAVPMSLTIAAFAVGGLLAFLAAHRAAAARRARPVPVSAVAGVGPLDSG